MLTSVIVTLALLVAAGWVNARARIVLAFAAIVGGVVLIVVSGSTPQGALGASVLLASGSVALGGLFFRPKPRIAFGLVTSLPFAFVALAAWPLMGSAETSEVGTNLVLLALAGVVALIALCVGRSTRTDAAAG